MPKFTVWVQQCDGEGGHHVSVHEAETISGAKEAAISETLADWDWPQEATAVLRILGVAEGDVNLLEWEE